MPYRLTSRPDRISGVAVARNLGKLMYELNVVDTPTLVRQNPLEPDSVYHHLSEALRAVLRQLGVDDADETAIAMASGQWAIELPLEPASDQRENR